MITEILTLLVTMWITVQCGDTMPELTPYKSNITITLGSLLRIDCPIRAQTSDNGPNGLMFSWSVRGVDENMVATDPRYSFVNHSRTAIIKNVKSADSGVYKCRGVTGFGNQEATFYVNIPEHQSCSVSDSSPNPVPQRPCFLDATMQNSENKVLTIHRNVGSSVEFRCHSGGYPKPSYVWFMGKSLAGWIHNVDDVRKPVLSIQNLRIEYTGHYTCRVSNPHGKISFTFALVVKESPEGLPKIMEGMQNTTAVIGSSAELLGSISCKCNPIIQWLQRDDNQSIPNKSKRNIISLPQATSSEIGELYMTIDNDSDQSFEDSVRIEISRQTNGIIVSKLKFLSVKPWHAGKYVLLTMSRQKASVHEISYQTVFLEVLQDKSMGITDKSNSPPKIIVYIAVPFGILILCVIIILYCFVRRKGSSTGHSIVGDPSLKSKRSISSNNHSMSITGVDAATKACLKHGTGGNPTLMTLTSSLNSNIQYNPPRISNSGNSPYIIQGQMVPGQTLVPAPSSNSSNSHQNSCHKNNHISTHSSSNESSVLGKQPQGPPSNSPYSYSNNPPYKYYHQYNRKSNSADYQPSASVPSNNASLSGNIARENSSNDSNFSASVKHKLNNSNQSLNANSIMRTVPTTRNSGATECNCSPQYFIPDLINNHGCPHYGGESKEQSFQLPPSLCFDGSNSYHSTAAYFPGHNSSSSASLTYS